MDHKTHNKRSKSNEEDAPPTPQKFRAQSTEDEGFYHAKEHVISMKPVISQPNAFTVMGRSCKMDLRD